MICDSKEQGNFWEYVMKKKKIIMPVKSNYHDMKQMLKK